jgi:hypothetical protein
MTESQIETMAERRMDRLDRDFLSNKINSTEYDDKISEIRLWVKAEIQNNSLALFQHSK